jgi:HEAT repeat protein
MKAAVMAAVADIKNVYEYAGALTSDQAKDLIARRQKETGTQEAQLAALGPGGAQAITASYSATDDPRTRLMLIHALSTIQDPQAVEALQAVLAGETSFSLQRAIVAAIGQQPGAESIQVLGEIAATSTDSRLQFAAAQALSGRPEALPVLTQLVQAGGNADVQKELIISIGAIGNQSAQGVLAGIAQGNSDVGIRETAIQELARGFGDGALGVFQQLLNDPNEAIRQNAVMAVSQVHNDQAVALLRRTATSDSSEQVRQRAQAFLAPPL